MLPQEEEATSPTVRFSSSSSRLLGRVPERLSGSCCWGKRVQHPRYALILLRKKILQGGKVLLHLPVA